MIWQRYVFFKLLKSLALFLGSLLFLYILIDYSGRASTFHKLPSTLFWKTILLYYASNISKELAALLPFAALLSSIHVACSLMQHNELTAMRAAGFSIHTLTRPFLLLGLLLTACLFLNQEFIEPHAYSYVQKIRAKKKAMRQAIHAIFLPDGARLLYLTQEKEQLRDVFFIPSIDEVWHFASLNSATAEGEDAVQWKRDAEGNLTVAKRLLHARAPISLRKKDLERTELLDSEKPLRALHSEITSLIYPEGEKESLAVASFFGKLAAPLVALAVMIAPLPFALRFTRNPKPFFLYTSALFSLVAYLVFMDAAMVLASHETALPILAIAVPESAFFAVILFRHARLNGAV